jgi:nucleotide-binding universal stress UspA family protein
MLQPRSVQQKTFKLKKILIPLDSESIHDDSLPFAKKLALAYKAELHLLTVIPTLGTLPGEQAAAGNLMPTTAAAALDLKEEVAKEHLQTHLDELCRAGFEANAEVARGDPARTIAASGKRVGADLILLSTHRKAGMDAFWARSVAPNVARRTRIPLLLVPLG